MSYRIAFERPAEKDFRRLPREVQQAFANQLSTLSEDPRPPTSRKLKGTSDCYRIRHGDYRLVYTVLDDRIVVLVVRVGHRSDIYRDIPGIARAVRESRKRAR